MESKYGVNFSGYVWCLNRSDLIATWSKKSRMVKFWDLTDESYKEYTKSHQVDEKSPENQEKKKDSKDALMTFDDGQAGGKA